MTTACTCVCHGGTRGSCTECWYASCPAERRPKLPAPPAPSPEHQAAAGFTREEARLVGILLGCVFGLAALLVATAWLAS